MEFFPIVLRILLMSSVLAVFSLTNSFAVKEKSILLTIFVIFLCYAQWSNYSTPVCLAEGSSPQENNCQGGRHRAVITNL